MTKEFEKTTKEEFDEYIKAYPRQLSADVARMCEPPLGTYNDFTLGEWPESVVAKVVIMDGSSYYDHKHSEYYLPKDREKIQ